jgi:hypothetical protein
MIYQFTLVMNLKVQMFMQKRFSVLKLIKRTALLLMFLNLFFINPGCGNKKVNSPKKDTSDANPATAVPEEYPDVIKAKPFLNSDSTWGFTIYLNGKIYIHQQIIPGHEQTSGFQTENDAVKAADLVMLKMKKHISPEIVNEKELDSLGIIKTEIKAR